MDAATMRNNGYRVSLQVSDDEVDKAYNDVLKAYVFPIYETDRPTWALEAGMQLAFILLCQRSTVATRSGGKVKTSPSLSENGYPTQADFENADRLLREVQINHASDGAKQGDPSKIVDDICGIYYRQKYFAL